jgi:hypothetical protein
MEERRRGYQDISDSLQTLAHNNTRLCAQVEGMTESIKDVKADGAERWRALQTMAEDIAAVKTRFEAVPTLEKRVKHIEETQARTGGIMAAAGAVGAAIIAIVGAVATWLADKTG